MSKTSYLKTVCLILFGFIAQFTFGQCPTTDISFTTQAEIDQFTIDYPNCTELVVNIGITGDSSTGNDITNLQGLENLTSISGHLNILYNSNLVNLQGLENITSIGGDLVLFSNPSLVNLEGLNNLTSIGALNLLLV